MLPNVRSGCTQKAGHSAHHFAATLEKQITSRGGDTARPCPPVFSFGLGCPCVTSGNRGRTRGWEGSSVFKGSWQGQVRVVHGEGYSQEWPGVLRPRSLKEKLLKRRQPQSCSRAAATAWNRPGVAGKGGRLHITIPRLQRYNGTGSMAVPKPLEKSKLAPLSRQPPRQEPSPCWEL